MLCLKFAYSYARYAELMPFGHISSHSQMHYTENYTLAWAALRGDALTRRYVYILPYFYFI